MFTAQELLVIYSSFAFMCALPWLFNWAMHGAMPVTTRLLAALVFLCALLEAGNVLWAVSDELPERFNDVLTVFFPLLAVSALGLFFVAVSLAKIVKKSIPPEEK